MRYINRLFTYLLIVGLLYRARYRFVDMHAFYPSGSEFFSQFSDAPMLVVPRVHTELARRAYSVAAPSTWNCLPADIRLCENILTFKRHLKTHLFKLT